MPPSVTTGAVRSYRTLSPLPPPYGGLAVCFLLHFPWTHVPQVLPGALPWEPGLSSTLARSDCLADSGAHGGGATVLTQAEKRNGRKKAQGAHNKQDAKMEKAQNTLNDLAVNSNSMAGCPSLRHLRFLRLFLFFF